ncbi:hypothetical protein AY599_17195, partial [Leptolyngbya valderiana BDU 20041]
GESPDGGRQNANDRTVRSIDPNSDMTGNAPPDARYPDDRAPDPPVTPESFEYLLERVEAELLRSRAYQQALDSLKEMFGESAYAAQMMVHAVSREAILLALKRVSQQPNSARSQPSKTSPPPRAIYLYRVGRYYRSQRQKQGFSLAQVHHLTHIPLPHLHALESGHVYHFPQSPSYLYGTIRLWGNALGLDGHRIATGIPPSNSKPVPPPPPKPVPVSRPPQVKLPPPPKPKALRPHPDWLRYVAYGTPLVATVGVSLWMSHLSPNDEPEERSPAPLTTQEPTSIPSVNLNDRPGTQSWEISPPEEMHRRRD